MTRISVVSLVLLSAFAISACPRKPDSTRSPEAKPTQPSVAEVEGKVGEVKRLEDLKKSLVDPVALWREGRVVDYVERAESSAKNLLVLDLGEEWTPYLFTDGVDSQGNLREDTFRETYIQLAREDFPNNLHGWRARQDKYLELYGIIPTIHVLKQRMEAASSRECIDEASRKRLEAFGERMIYDRRQAEQMLARASELQALLSAAATREGLSSIDEVVSAAKLTDDERKALEEYQKIDARREVIRIVQKRLQCEGYFSEKTRLTDGIFDWETTNALAEFERRYRIFGWGYLAGETLKALTLSGAELERNTLVRVLTERAMLDAGVIEDGTATRANGGKTPTYTTPDGVVHEVPDLQDQLRTKLIDAFGLQSPESAFKWLQKYGEPESHRYVAIDDVPRPAYYGDNMALSVEHDRGDVWYEFPYGPKGEAKPMPVTHRPRLTLFVTYNGQRIPLTVQGTTIGGWRTEFIEGEIYWMYKESPAGVRAWSRIVAAPVWVPPESSPPKQLVRKWRGKYELDRHVTGPSYASAYGLVAAYHRKAVFGSDGSVRLGGDEGIRTHGSVDYMSIMRRFSHGCHRMHNHIAVRVMTFVLRHWPNTRVGHEKMVYGRDFEYEGQRVSIRFDQGGYEFDLKPPLPANVLEGRIRGAVKHPILHPLPRYNKEVGAYVMPNGAWVRVSPAGVLTERAGTPVPFLDPSLLLDLGEAATGDGLVAPIGGADNAAAASPIDLPTDASADDVKLHDASPP